MTRLVPWLLAAAWAVPSPLEAQEDPHRGRPDAGESPAPLPAPADASPAFPETAGAAPAATATAPAATAPEPGGELQVLIALAELLEPDECPEPGVEAGPAAWTSPDWSRWSDRLVGAAAGALFVGLVWITTGAR